MVKNDSPIDVNTERVVKTEPLVKPEFHYSPFSFQVKNTGHSIELEHIHHRHSDVIVYPNDYMFLDGTEYDLLQAHFHAPSEHTIDGRHGAMELHLVHKDTDGNIAVVGVLIDPGAENPTLKETFTRLPQSKGLGAKLKDRINLSAFLPPNPAWYRYDGSLTSPPYTKGVKWCILTTLLELSQSQIDAFTGLYPNSNRHVHDLHGRTVYITE